MIINCEVCVVGPGLKSRWSRARIGLGMYKYITYVVVITQQMNYKFDASKISKIHSSTVSFISPERHLMIRQGDMAKVKIFFSHLRNIKDGKRINLPLISEIEGQKPKPTSLNIVGENYNLNEFKNDDLQKVSFEKITQLPKCVWNLKNLRNLAITNSGLKVIPPRSLSICANLRILSLAKNNIKKIESFFFHNLEALISFDMSENELEYIPLEIGLLKNLTTANFNNNKIKHLPYTIGHNIKLKELYIASNNIEILSQTTLEIITKNLRLTKLDVSGNSVISAPNRQLLSYFPTLIDLCLRKVLFHLSLVGVIDEYIPKFIYYYVQLNAEICYKCRKPFVGRFKCEKGARFFLSRLASSVVFDRNFSNPIFPALYYCCYCNSVV